MRKQLFLSLLLLSASAAESSVKPIENATSSATGECVILLHGLARTATSMNKLAGKLTQAGYAVANIDYPSRHHPIADLADKAIKNGLQQCRKKNLKKVNFVTHSLGGILVRDFLSRNDIPELNRVVMLGPPNQGSEVVDSLHDLPGYEAFNGPAGMQLGTRKTDIPAQLGAVTFELGVIAGTRTINLILSSLLPGSDDGKVTVESTKVAGMQDFIALPVTHPMMMKNNHVIDQTLHFLKHGTFKHSLQ